MIRSTNTGISALVDATGEIRSTLGVHQRGVLTGSVTRMTGAPTLAVAWGEWLGPTAPEIDFERARVALLRTLQQLQAESRRGV